VAVWEHWISDHERVVEVCDETSCFYSIDVFLQCRKVPVEILEHVYTLKSGRTALQYFRLKHLEGWTGVSSIELVFVIVEGIELPQLVSVRALSRDRIEIERIVEIRDKAFKLVERRCTE